jgi:hypothetical protein
MARWTCPRCDREFGRANQSHTCLPGNSVDASFRGRPEQRAIYDAIMRHLETLGPVHADAVSVGVFLKSDRKLAELRPKAKWLECALYLPAAIDDPRVARSQKLSVARVVNFFKLRTPDDVDAQVCEWLTEAFELATE